ncbi:hypothetical protein THRCLA_20983 [Thraustotheca clavata]|uniref:Uncharacterized protein n=1 Tax=Thraustotheca clavata TaxID=74557 RepID=A0A1W0A1K5_9STRA|nr:hypothetical protein THRCLA_20983 [Thraustotheca clavata]
MSLLGEIKPVVVDDNKRVVVINLGSNDYMWIISELWNYQQNCSISIDLCHRGSDIFFHQHKPLNGFAFGQNYDENITILPGVRNFSYSDEPHVTFAVFETPLQHHNMLQILANQMPMTNFFHFNVARFFGIPVSYSASWGELIDGQPCIWIGFRTAEFGVAWQSFKFAARFLLTVYIAWQTWNNYYRHYIPLIHNLAVWV